MNINTITSKARLLRDGRNIFRSVSLCLKYRMFSKTVSPIVTINDGQIKGNVAKDERGDTFFSFQKIPYAKPPLGSLRFKAPQPVEKWSGILDGTKQGKGCYARNFMGNGFVGDEDCLFLNVYTPNLPEKNYNTSLKPVMFWIHGGGFTSGSSKTDLYGPEFLMPENVVLVTINYRLGALGFLRLDDTSLGVPGNAGLKDMVLALKWVQNNIKQFGGDPNNVTIFGESAGGAAVHYLMLSPSSKGLFHKAIAQSGCALNPWARGDPTSTKKLAEILGITSKDEKTILDVLQSMSIQDLFANGVTKIKDNFSPGHLRPFCPVIEKNTADGTNFITEDPVNIIKSGNYHKVPMIMGCTSREGMILHASLPKQHLLTDFTLVPQNMNLEEGSVLYKEIAKKIKSFYLKGDNEDNVDNIFKLYTDNYFLLEVYKSVKYHLETTDQPIYFYRFSLDTDMNFLKKVFGIKEPGACHVDDIPYLFKGVASPEIKPDTPEDIGIRRMTKLWTDFARYGNPTPSTSQLIPTIWLPTTKSQFHFLDIANELKMDVDVEKEAMDFWKALDKDLNLKNKL